MRSFFFYWISGIYWIQAIFCECHIEMSSSFVAWSMHCFGHSKKKPDNVISSKINKRLPTNLFLTLMFPYSTSLLCPSSFLMYVIHCSRHRCLCMFWTNIVLSEYIGKCFFDFIATSTFFEKYPNFFQTITFECFECYRTALQKSMALQKFTKYK